MAWFFKLERDAVGYGGSSMMMTQYAKSGASPSLLPGWLQALILLVLISSISLMSFVENALGEPSSSKTQCNNEYERAKHAAESSHLIFEAKLWKELRQLRPELDDLQNKLYHLGGVASSYDSPYWKGFIAQHPEYAKFDVLRHRPDEKLTLELKQITDQLQQRIFNDIWGEYKKQEKKIALDKKNQAIAVARKKLGQCLQKVSGISSRVPGGVDYGDAPDSNPEECKRNYQPICQWHYPTLEVNNGAMHMDTSVAWLGRDVSPDSAAKIVNRDKDDFIASYEIFNATWNGSLYVNVLIDKNGDGDWEDPDDWVVQNSSYIIPKGKSQKISVVGPPSGLWYRITLTGQPI